MSCRTSYKLTISKNYMQPTMKGNNIPQEIKGTSFHKQNSNYIYEQNLNAFYSQTHLLTLASPSLTHASTRISAEHVFAVIGLKQYFSQYQLRPRCSKHRHFRFHGVTFLHHHLELSKSHYHDWRWHHCSPQKNCIGKNARSSDAELSATLFLVFSRSYPWGRCKRRKGTSFQLVAPFHPEGLQHWDS